MVDCVNLLCASVSRARVSEKREHLPTVKLTLYNNLNLKYPGIPRDHWGPEHPDRAFQYPGGLRGHRFSQAINVPRRKPRHVPRHAATCSPGLLGAGGLELAPVVAHMAGPRGWPTGIA